MQTKIPLNYLKQDCLLPGVLSFFGIKSSQNRWPYFHASIKSFAFTSVFSPATPSKETFCFLQNLLSFSSNIPVFCEVLLCQFLMKFLNDC